MNIFNFGCRDYFFDRSHLCKLFLLFAVLCCKMMAGLCKIGSFCQSKSGQLLCLLGRIQGACRIFYDRQTNRLRISAWIPLVQFLNVKWLACFVLILYRSVQWLPGYRQCSDCLVSMQHSAFGATTKRPVLSFNPCFYTVSILLKFHRKSAVHNLQLQFWSSQNNGLLTSEMIKTSMFGNAWQ